MAMAVLRGEEGDQRRYDRTGQETGGEADTVAGELLPHQPSGDRVDAEPAEPLRNRQLVDSELERGSHGVAVLGAGERDDRVGHAVDGQLGVAHLAAAEVLRQRDHGLLVLVEREVDHGRGYAGKKSVMVK